MVGRGEGKARILQYSVLNHPESDSPSWVSQNDASDQDDGESGMGRSIEFLNGCTRDAEMEHSLSLRDVDGEP